MKKFKVSKTVLLGIATLIYGGLLYAQEDHAGAMNQFQLGFGLIFVRHGISKIGKGDDKK